MCDDHVKIILIDTLGEERWKFDGYYANLLRVRKFNRRVGIPFSGYFNIAQTLGESGKEGNDNNHFDGPSDIIKINGFVFVSDFRNRRIQVYSRKKLYFTLMICASGLDGGPLRLEKSIDGLFFTYGASISQQFAIVKINLSNLFNIMYLETLNHSNSITINTGRNDDGLIMWKDIKSDNISSIKSHTITNQLEDNHLLFVLLSYNGIEIIRSKDGTCVGKIDTILIQGNDLLIFNLDEKAYMLSLSQASLSLFEIGTNIENPFKFCTKFEHIIYSNTPSYRQYMSFGMAVNEGMNVRNILSSKARLCVSYPSRKITREILKHKQILISQSSNNKVHIFDLFQILVTKEGQDPKIEWDYEFVKSFGYKKSTNNQSFNTPTGLLVDDDNGELFIVDSGNHRIQIFR